MPSVLGRMRSALTSATRSVRRAFGRLFTRRPARPARPAPAPFTPEVYVEAVPNNALSPNGVAEVYVEAVPNNALSLNDEALVRRLRKLANPTQYNVPRRPVSARAPRAPTVPGGIASNQGMALIAARTAARTAARAAAAADEAAAREAARQREVLEETIAGIARLMPRNFKRLVREIDFATFERLNPAIQDAIAIRVSSDLNHDEVMMIHPDVRLLMSERAEPLGLSFP